MQTSPHATNLTLTVLCEWRQWSCVVYPFYTLGFPYVNVFTICSDLLGRYSFQFVDKGTEARSADVTCSRWLGHSGSNQNVRDSHVFRVSELLRKFRNGCTSESNHFQGVEDISKQNISLSLKPLFRKLFIVGHPENIFLLQKWFPPWPHVNKTV